MRFFRFAGSERSIKVLLVFAGLSLLPLRAIAGAQDATVFTLGTFDGSSYEFASGAPRSAVQVRANSPDAVHEWYSFQPAVNRASAGRHDPALQPRSILFSIPGKPQPAYTVRVSLLFESACVPALRVTINGRSGDFYPDPELDRRMGDGGAVSFPAYSHAMLSIPVPGSFLHAGQNDISFAAVAPDEEQVANAGVNYDAISMSAGQEKHPSVRLTPTIFYKRANSGLEEGIDAIVSTDASPVRRASVTVRGSRYEIPLQAGFSWGEEKFRFFVPEFPSHTRAQIEIERNGATDDQEENLVPGKRWTIDVVPHVHLDIGYTDYQAKVASVQSRIIDEALDLFDLHPDFRFSLDGMWSMDQFLATRTDADRERAIKALKAKQLFIPAQYSNELTGFASAEALFRSLYPSVRFDAQHGLPLNYANITDVPSYSWSYASVLGSAGIHELVAGSNNGRAPVLLRGHLDENSPFWWEGPDGQKVLFWYSRHYHQMWMLFGLPPQISPGEQILPVFLQMYGRPTYKASSVIVYGSQVENTDLFPEQASFAAQWNERYAYPRLQYTGFHEALTSIAAEFKGDIPTVRGDGGPYWEDGVAADARYAAMERDTEARAPSAEKLATISSLQNPRISVDLTRFRGLWKNIVLMDEHTWLSAESFTDSQNDEATVQLAVKDLRAEDAHWATDGLLRESMANLADSINVRAGSIIVFNPLNWPRSGFVSLDLRKGTQLVDNVSGSAVPLTETEHGEHTNRVTFRAVDVPAVGYRTYSIVPQRSEDAVKSIAPQTTMENAFYRVQLDPSTGSIRSIFDKELRREVANLSSPYRFGQYLYVATTHDNGETKYVVHGSSQGRLLSVTESPEELSAVMKCSAPQTPVIRTTVSLSKNERKILLTEDVEKNATKDDEAVYFAFPLALSHPRFEYEIQNGAVDPAHDMMPGAGLDWFSAQHWAAAEQDGLSAAIFPLDASLLTFGDISRVAFPQSFGTRTGTIFSYVMNNYWHTNYRAEQGGHFRFRYMVTSDSTIKPAELSREGWEEATPLEATEVTASDKAVETKRPLDGVQASFLDANDPALVLETWKTAEDGRGTILRFLDLGGTKRTVHLRFPHLSVAAAWIDDAVERDQSSITVDQDGGVDMEVTPHSFTTLRILNREAPPPLCGRFCTSVQ